MRWTIGDASARGFEALRLSLWGAFRLFGSNAEYVVCVNRIDPAEARARTGHVPATVEWRPPGAVPGILEPFLRESMADSVAWKFAPLRLFPGPARARPRQRLHSLGHAAGDRCLAARRRGRLCVIAEDVSAGFGQFASVTGPAPRNSGIRGLSPGFDFGEALRSVLSERPATLESELDEQGLQVAAVARRRAPLVVGVEPPLRAPGSTASLQERSSRTRSRSGRGAARIVA